VRAWGFVAAGDRTPFDFVSRVFASAVGIDQDPVTGSAHCALGPLWAERLGRNRLHAYHASPRGGEMGVVVGDDRITLIGQAVTVLRAQLGVD
jgi:predicted PhzF superfamily epimerase YddE/YHI9